jgi:hypothetical protein
MKKVNQNKVQQAFISYLLQEGHVQLILPNEMILEVGITQENENGDLEKIPDYCWVIASQKGRSVSIDEYNLGLRYQNKNDRMICEHEAVSNDGENIKILDII